MSKLFQKKNESERRRKQLLVRVTDDECEKIQVAAGYRQLDVAEFMRRAALGRKADVRYETEIVLKLSEVVQTLRALHKVMVELKMEPPVQVWEPVVEEAVAAMLRISK